MLLYSPLEQFLIYEIIPIHIGPLDLSISNYSIVFLLTIFIWYMITNYFNTKATIVGNRWQWAIEQLLEFIDTTVINTCGTSALTYSPYFLALFVFILTFNLLGMIPYVPAVTSYVIVTFALSCSLWLQIMILGFKIHRSNFLAMFLPAGSPIILAPLLIIIEILTYTIRALSLGLRLAANITSGHILLGLIGLFAAQLFIFGSWGTWVATIIVILLILLITLELVVALIQAYVFTLLGIIYINDSINLH